jgi:VWFA-related protein
MRKRARGTIINTGLALLCVGSFSFRASAQTQKPSPTPSDDVIRTNTDLVQTDVMVFDKSGKFVNGLNREQFELTVDGKPLPISFFEQVRAGTTREMSVRRSENGPTAVAEASTVNENRGRTIVFFIDDLHLAPDSLARTRKTLAQFIDNEMTETDRVALASTSGDIGFLQQFTDNKSVLRAAAGRLTHHSYNVRDMTDSQTPMTEYMALTIERKDDPGVLNFYVDRCLQEAYPLKYKRQTCEVQVQSRARLILLQAASVILNTYSSLESLMQTAKLMPGRKLVFFVSDGFLLDTGPRNADSRGKLQTITDTALRAGAVIYTIDARGLFSGQLDATNNIPFDRQNRLESASLREGPASQDALNALAGDTGGRALRNQNYFDRWVNKILDETSQYYLLAWRPNNQAETSSDFKHISVRVVDHPEYTVRLPRGFVNKTSAAVPPAASDIQSPAQIHRDIQQALTTVNPKHEILTSLAAVFLDTPDNGAVLTASVQIANESLSYAPAGGKQNAAVDIAGVAVNDRGKPAGSFQTRLNVSPIGSNRDNSSSIYNSRLKLAPGLYQVRVATRDINSGRVGSAQQWIEIPDLKLRQLTLSSLLLGLQSVGDPKGNHNSSQVQFNVDHRFGRNEHLGFIAFVYNAAQGSKSISYQARILKMGQPVIATPWQKASDSSPDQARILCNGDIPLSTVPAGEYTLELTVTDSLSKTSASQQVRIRVD